MISNALLFCVPTKNPFFNLLLLLSCAFVVIQCIRYFHQLPFLLWMTKLPNLMRFALMAAIEIAFNVYPAQAWSSLLLQGSHWIILVSLAFADVPEPYAKEEPSPPSAASLGAAGERLRHGSGATASAASSSTSDVAVALAAAKKIK